MNYDIFIKKNSCKYVCFYGGLNTFARHGLSDLTLHARQCIKLSTVIILEVTVSVSPLALQPLTALLACFTVSLEHFLIGRH